MALDSPRTKSGHWEKIPQSGRALGDPGWMSRHRPRHGGRHRDRCWYKVDNLVQIGHASRVGENTSICAQTGLARAHWQQRHSWRGRHCRPLQGGRRRYLKCAVGGLSRCAAGKMISGFPGFDNRVWLRAVTIFQRMVELLKCLHCWKTQRSEHPVRHRDREWKPEMKICARFS